MEGGDSERERLAGGDEAGTRRVQEFGGLRAIIEGEPQGLRATVAKAEIAIPGDEHRRHQGPWEPCETGRRSGGCVEFLA
jgi:hypothetical protein